MVLDFLAHGLWQPTWWQVLLFTLVTTHVTIASVTIFLHRHQAHRALDLHPLAAHFFRFWLWLTTGTVTKEWTAVHRKHHARCERPGDPHSPVVFGIRKVFWQGYELYRAECANAETLRRFGHNTPDDWLERHVYARHTWLGITLLLLTEVALLGSIGLTVWAIQMVWIPITAAGVINGVGHWWGYRNFESSDASTNVSPWGLLIGGEELHNNHHTYPTSAKLSVRPYELDIGWAYIRVLQGLRLATVKKTPPRLRFGAVKPVADENTLEALIANRYEVMARFARELRQVCRAEITVLKVRRQDFSALMAARRWLPLDREKVPPHAQPSVAHACACNPVLEKMLTMREELQQLWLNRAQSREQLVSELQAWCARAEKSGITVLAEFSRKLRSVHFVPNLVSN